MPLKITSAKLLAVTLCATLSPMLYAQSVETFEPVVGVTGTKPTSFGANGQPFSIINVNCATGGTFGVFVPNLTYVPCTGSGSQTSANVSNYGVGTSCSSGSCSGTSAKFIDAAPSPATPQVYSIKSTNAALFTIKALYIYLSVDGSVTPSAAGGVTFQGKVAGSTVFTYNKTTGFNGSFGLNNGFTFIDFATVGYANTNIDELQITNGAGGNYIAIDNFTWGISVPLPLGLTAFNAKAAGSSVLINWSSSAEADIEHYELQRSIDSKTFVTLAGISPQADQKYNFRDDKYYDGDNFYRLKMVSTTGNITYSPVALVQMSKMAEEAMVYPNPATDKVMVAWKPGAAATFQLIDVTGRVVKSEPVVGKTEVSLEHLSKGLYHYQIIGKADGLRVQGKLLKQ